MSDPRAELEVVLGDRYTVNREIGRGGMAVVYHATDNHLGRSVAIKVLSPDLTPLLGEVRFHREIQVVSRLQHPGIVPLYEAGGQGQLLFYTMPFIEGETLRQLLDREQELPVEEAVRIAGELADALAYAHSHGVVHRDLKPENVLLTGGRVQLADFGIAHAITMAGEDRLTSASLAIGTPAYMSPEQAGHDAVIDGRSDVYSLGCLLFEMLAGQTPFTAPTARAVIARHLAEPVPSIRVVRSTVPVALETLIHQALAKVPADRPTAAALLGRLRAVTPIAPSHHQGMSVRITSAVVAIAVVAAAGFWLATSGGTSLLDHNTVVVFPLVTTDDSTADLGWRSALAIEAALEHAEPLRSIDGWTRLDPEVRARPELLTAAMALAIGRDRGAGYYLEGAVRSTGDSLALTLRLHDVAADSIVGQTTGVHRAGVGAVEQLAAQALVALLPHWLDPGREVDLSPFLDRRPAALALLVQGDREYRHSRFGAALTFYQRAVAADSLLAFAAVKGAQAASWTSNADEANVLIGVALQHRAMLPAKYRQYADGLASYLAGAADDAERHFRRAVSTDPNWPEGWMALGDVYYHLLPSRVHLDSLATQAFLNATEAGYGFTPALIHLAEIAIRQDDLTRGASLLAQLRSETADSTAFAHLAWMLACSREGTANFRWPNPAGTRVADVLEAAKSLSAAGRQSACAEGGFAAILADSSAPANYRWAATEGLHGLLLGRGQATAAAAILDTGIVSGLRGPYMLAVFDAVAGFPVGSRADDAVRMMRTARGSHYDGAAPSARWLLTAWHLRQGDDALVDTLIEPLRHGEDPVSRLGLAALTADRLLVHGDTMAAIAAYQSLASSGSISVLEWEPMEPLALERMQLADLQFATGAFSDAIATAAIFDHPGPVVFLAFLGRSLQLRANAADSLGRPREATLYRRRIAALTKPAT